MGLRSSSHAIVHARDKFINFGMQKALKQSIQFCLTSSITFRHKIYTRKLHIKEKAKTPFGEGSLAKKMENTQGFQVTKYVYAIRRREIEELGSSFFFHLFPKEVAGQNPRPPHLSDSPEVTELNINGVK